MWGWVGGCHRYGLFRSWLQEGYFDREDRSRQQVIILKYYFVIK